jgi:nitroimidazol reductase NimA-like FMN-containing flavoprotein (pyridoxamine 5'-phosphate oxidase superfamily)
MTDGKREIVRKPHRGISELAEIYSILDEGLIAHIGFNDPDTNEPTVIPVAYGRDGNRIIFHGSTGSRLFMALKKGAPICATVTLLDGIVAARSPFNSSMNYRSVMAFGTARVLEGDEKAKALYAVSERLVPGLWDAGREQTAKEFAQTMAVELVLDDVTAKKRVGGAIDDDAALPIWAGVIPLSTHYGEPITNEDARHLPIPDYIKDLRKKRNSS